VTIALHLHSPEGVTGLAQPYKLKIAKFSLSPSRLAPSLEMTPFEFMEKLYGSWN